MIKKIVYLLVPLIFIGCSFDEEVSDVTSTQQTNSTKEYSFTKEQAHRYAQIANDFVLVHLDDILGKAYLDTKTPPLFEFFYHVSKIKDKEYITVFLHEKPSTIADLDEVFAKGYTNVIFEINSKADNLYVPNLAKIYPAYAYLTAKIEEQGIKEGDDLDIRFLMDMEAYYGNQFFFEPVEKRLLRAEDLLDGKKYDKESSRYQTKMIPNVWLPEIFIPKFPPSGPPDGSSPFPPRPTWSVDGNTYGTPPTGGGSGSGGFGFPRPGTGSPTQDTLTPEQEKWRKIKKGENIVADPDVLAAIEEQWKKSLDLPAGERQERGFCIYYSEETGKYYVGLIQEGPIITDLAESAYIRMFFDTSVAHGSELGLPDDAKLVAYYHNHTPVSEEGYGREAGPSGDDIRLGNINEITMIVKDFKGEKGNKGKIMIDYNRFPKRQNTEFYYHHSN